jgi:hypothetical protein
MAYALSWNSFGAIKFFFGSFFLILSVFSPLTSLIIFAVLALGRAHSIGAWLGMWRAGKLTLTYVVYTSAIIVLIAFLGFKVLSFNLLVLVSSLLFTFHFFFDELENSQEKNNLASYIASLTPGILGGLFFIDSFFKLNISIIWLLVIFVVGLFFEMNIHKKISWHFFQMKMISFFIICSFLIDKNSTFLLSVFLMYHYIFWFIYPVYKLHKYKREERDGFIIILFLIVASSLFIYSTKIWGGGDQITENFIRGFHVASLVHVLVTAPFAYYFGLARPRLHDAIS